MRRIKFGDLLEKYRIRFDDGTKTDMLDSLKDWNVSYIESEESGKRIVYILLEPKDE